MKAPVFLLASLIGITALALDEGWSRGPRTSTETFFAQCVDTTRPGLREIPAKMAAGDIAGAERLFANEVRATLKPQTYLKDDLADKLSAKQLKKLKKSAEAVMDYRLSSCGTPCHFANHRIDWETNATYNAYREWTWQLSRHPFLSTLARYYLATRDERAAETWVAMLGSWFDQATLPKDGTSGYATKCWRNIEAGIRMPAWAYQIHAFLDSPRVSDRFITAFFRSIWEHGHRMTDVQTRCNWRQHELMGLMYIGELYPFLKDAQSWRDYALAEIEKTFDDQVYPDGFQYELTTGYHCCVIGNYRSIMAIYNRFNRPVPAFFLRNLERMYAMAMPLTLPLGNTPPLNDGGKIWTKNFLARVLGDYPHRKDFLWFATDGKQGEGPKYLSSAMPYAGAVVFRSSWARDAVGAYMDCSPFGSNHQHEDKLNFILQAYGKDMIVEAGTYDYDTSDMRRYVLDTRSHNTIRINGQEQRSSRTYAWKSEMIREKADLAFETGTDRDWCRATFNAGYGPGSRKKPLDLTTHTRTAIFHKNVPAVGPFFVIVDRLQAPDGQPRSWEAMWHLETTNATVAAQTFTAGFGDGVGLFGAVSDASARVVDRRGQKKPYFQGWMPIHKSGPHEHRAIATPVVEGTFTRSHRVVTILVPFGGGATTVKGIAASSDTNAKDYTITFTDGSSVRMTE